MSVFDKHHDTLEHHETMMGSARGRLAVALDLLTDSLALVGQHGVYCRSERFPGKPKMDIALVLEQLDDAKQLVQSAMEELRSSNKASEADVRQFERLPSSLDVSLPAGCSGFGSFVLSPPRQDDQPQQARHAEHRAERERQRPRRPPGAIEREAGPVARDRRRQRDERELRREHAAAKPVRHFHLQQHRAEHPQIEPPKCAHRTHRAASEASARPPARRRSRRR